MSFPAYESYKDSGVKWVGAVPSHWTIGPLKRAVEFTTGWTPPTGRDEFYDGDQLWANISDLDGRYLEDTAKKITEAAVVVSGIKVSPAGSLLFSFKLSIGQVAFAQREMFTNEAIATFASSTKVDLSFAYYAFSPLRSRQRGREHLRREDAQPGANSKRYIGAGQRPSSSAPSRPSSTGRPPRSTRWWRRSGG